MKTAQGNMLVSLDAVNAFLDEHADALPGVVTTGTRHKLRSAIADLAAFRSDQAGGALIAQGSTQHQASLRKVLMRDHMAHIARIAKAELVQTPELLPLRMPRGRPTIPKLVAAAEGMGKAAAPYVSVFTEHGLPADFIQQLESSASLLLDSASTHKNIQGRRRTATEGLAARLSAGRRIVHVLDAYVQTALKDDPSLLAGWNSVKRVQRTGMRAAPVQAHTIATSSPSTPTTAATTRGAVAA